MMNVDQTISDLTTLPVDDRLRVVHAIWDTLPDDVDLAPTPGQQAELDRRLAAHRSDSHAFWNPGSKSALLVFVALMVGLKIIDTIVQDNGILSPTWRWSLIAGLCGGVYASVVNAYQLGLKNARNRTTDL